MRIVPQKERKVYCGKREIADRTAERTENLPQEIKKSAILPQGDAASGAEIIGAVQKTACVTETIRKAEAA